MKNDYKRLGDYIREVNATEPGTSQVRAGYGPDKIPFLSACV